MNDGNPRGVLIIHGFGGDRSEVQPLADRLKAAGFRVVVPLLPGHGQDRGLLARATRKHWGAAVERAYENLAGQCEEIYVVGFSMGGLLAVNLLAARFPDGNRQDDGLRGLVMVNTPVYYWNFKQVIANIWADRARRRSDQVYAADSQGSAVLERYRNSTLSYPVRAMLQFQLLLSRTKRLYRQIYCPALIIQAADDDTVWPTSGDYILGHLKGTRKLLKLPQGGHQIFQSKAGPEACAIVEDFLKSRPGRGC